MTCPALPDIAARRRANAFANLELRNRLVAAERMEPKDWQEAHAPTGAYMVKHSAETEVELTRRRRMDQRLWDAMSPDQERAALDIRDAFEYVAGRVSRVTARYGETSPGRASSETESEKSVRLQAKYWAWGSECRRLGVSATAALDVLVFGNTCGEIDRGRKKRNGWARDQLFQALAVFIHIPSRRH